MKPKKKRRSRGDSRGAESGTITTIRKRGNGCSQGAIAGAGLGASARKNYGRGKDD